MSEEVTLVRPKAGKEFVETPYVKDLISRAMKYIQAAFPIHFRGISGTGKTTLALKIAEMINRPVVLMHGDEELTTAHLVGSETGHHVRKLRDNFISSVLKIEEDSSKRWVDNRLTVAVKEGYTLIYDEFTRSRPEANNVLLSVLQEGILDMPAQGEGSDCIKVHPDFHMIFTSNPEEYAGVHRSQDALRDRMITLDLQPFDRETEILITHRKSELPAQEAARVVDVVRMVRESGQYEFAPTVRGCIMIAKTLKAYEGKVKASSHDSKFSQVCFDILSSETSRIGSSTTSQKVREIIKKAIQKHCRNGTS